MNASEPPLLLVQGVKRFEGLHRVATRRPVVTVVPYLCPASFWTIGYGTLCQKDSPAITEAQAEGLLMGALPVYMGHALRMSPVLWQEDNERRLTAIASFIYNLGPTRYAGSTLRRRVNARAWGDARQEMRRWVFGGGQKLPGLVARREWEAGLL